MEDLQLTLMAEVGKDKDGSRLGKFKCHCGNEWITRIRSVNSGQAKSCGCLQKAAVAETGRNNSTHGKSTTPEYYVYQTMIQRCTNPNNDQYKDYGGRGIKICDRWLESFENYYEDMGDRPSPELTVDREDNDLDYCKENCVWATQQEQASHKRNSSYIEYNGVIRTISEWARVTGIKRKTIEQRWKKGWSAKEVFEKPIENNERLLTHNGKTQTLTEWSKETGIKITTLITRLDKIGMSVEESLSTPVNKGHMVTYQGKTQNLNAWSQETGIHLDTLTYRLKVSKSLDEVFYKKGS